MEQQEKSCHYEHLSWGEQLSLLNAIRARLFDIESMTAVLLARKNGATTYVEAPDAEIVEELRQQLVDAANLCSFMVCGGPSFVEVGPLDVPPSDPRKN